jgi:hypothetical protein
MTSGVSPAIDRPSSRAAASVTEGLDLACPPEEGLDGTKLELRRGSGALESFTGNSPFREETFGQRYAPEMETLELARLGPLTQNQLGTASADINDQSQPVRRRHAVRHASVNQARFLQSRDNFDWMAERYFGLGHERAVLASAPNRAGTRGPHLAGVDVAKALAESRQAIERAFARRRGNVAAAREALGQAHGFANSIENSELAMAQLANDHVKAVGTEIDRRDDLGPIGFRR